MKKQKNIPIILRNFSNYLLSVKGYSLNTTISYCKDLLQFFIFEKSYLQIPVPIEQFNIFILGKIKEHQIIAFIVYLNMSLNDTATTRQRKLCAIRCFYKWLFSTFPYGNDKTNPTQCITNVEKIVRFPKCLTLEQAKKIQTIYTLENSNYYIRNNCIISIFLSTGIRVSELCNINIKDLNLDTGTIIINKGKGNKSRNVYLNKIAKSYIRRYLDYRRRRENAIDNCTALFINRYGNRIGIDAVENICKKAYKLLGLETMHYTVHTLRHTSAVMLYRQTRDILLVKEFLGHACIASTQVYMQMENQLVKESIDKNPLNDFIKKSA